jgi:hypothetical protein
MRRLGAPGARRTRFDPCDIDLIIERHKAGAKADVIAQELGCSVGGILAVLERRGFHKPIRRGPHHHSIRTAAARAGLGG